MSIFPGLIQAAMRGIFGQSMTLNVAGVDYPVVGSLRGLRADETVGSYEQADSLIVVAALEIPPGVTPARLDHIDVGTARYTVQFARLGYEAGDAAVWKFAVRGGVAM